MVFNLHQHVNMFPTSVLPLGLLHPRAIQSRVGPLFGSYGMECVVEIVEEDAWLLYEIWVLDAALFSALI